MEKSFSHPKHGNIFRVANDCEKRLFECARAGAKGLLPFTLETAEALGCFAAAPAPARAAEIVHAANRGDRCVLRHPREIPKDEAQGTAGAHPRHTPGSPTAQGGTGQPGGYTARRKTHQPISGPSKAGTTNPRPGALPARGAINNASIVDSTGNCVKRIVISEFPGLPTPAANVNRRAEKTRNRRMRQKVVDTAASLAPMWPVLLATFLLALAIGHPAAGEVLALVTASSAPACMLRRAINLRSRPISIIPRYTDMKPPDSRNPGAGTRAA